jgi:hypothetical protein
VSVIEQLTAAVFFTGLGVLIALTLYRLAVYVLTPVDHRENPHDR